MLACYLIYKCDGPLGLSKELFAALLGGGGAVVVLLLLVAAYFICRPTPEELGYREIMQEDSRQQFGRR